MIFGYKLHLVISVSRQFPDGLGRDELTLFTSWSGVSATMCLHIASKARSGEGHYATTKPERH